MVLHRLTLAALVAVLALPASALDYKLGAIEIGQPWTRATPATAKSGGGYLLLKNTGTTPDRLIAVKSPAADKAEIHEMKMDGNIMRMREVEKGIEIPPGATVELSPAAFTSCSWASRRRSPRTPRCRSPWCSRRRAASTSS